MTFNVTDDYRSPRQDGDDLIPYTPQEVGERERESERGSCQVSNVVKQTYQQLKRDAPAVSGLLSRSRRLPTASVL